MDLERIKKSLADFNDEIRQREDDFEDFEEEISDIYKMTAAEYAEYLARRATTPYGRGFAAFRDFVAAVVVPAYVGASAPERDAILDVFKGSLAAIRVWALVEEYSWRMAKTSADEKPTLFRTLLVFAILGEDHLGGHDTAHYLTSAWSAAESAGLDAAAFFREAGAIAGERPLAFGRSARDELRRFEPYTYGAFT